MDTEQPRIKPRISVSLTEPQLDWIDRRAASLGIGRGEMIRRIFDGFRQFDSADLRKFGIEPP